MTPKRPRDAEQREKERGAGAGIPQFKELEKVKDWKKQGIGIGNSSDARKRPRDGKNNDKKKARASKG